MAISGANALYIAVFLIFDESGVRCRGENFVRELVCSVRGHSADTFFVNHFGVHFTDSYRGFTDKGDHLEKVNVGLLISPRGFENISEIYSVAAETAEAPETEAPAAETAEPVKEDAADKPAAAESAPVQAEAPATTTYVVQEGDDMTSILIRFGVSAACVRELNNLSDDAQLKPGQVIKLPAETQQ